VTPELSAVVAVHGDARHLAAWLDAVRPQIAERAPASVEVLVCHPAHPQATPDEQRVRELCDGADWIQRLPGSAHSLVPQLCRDGIAAARAPRVALGVVDCLPDPDWLEALLAADLASYCAVGGAIDCDPASDSVGLAVYLLRYSRYARPFAAFETDDLAGDNALYDRQALVPHRAAYAEGFWEPEIHAKLLREGHRLLRDPAIAALHRNAYGALEFAAQRVAHGRRFGSDRARAMPALRRALYLALSPAVPLILGAKVVRLALAKRETRRALPRAAGALALFLLAWGAGEMRGIWDAMVHGAHRA